MVTLKISNKDVTDIITPPFVELVPRSQSVKYTLDGSTAIDIVGGHKYRITLEFPLVTGPRWNELAGILSNLSFTVSFSYNGTVNERAFRLDGSVPSPMAVYINGVYYYKDITVKLEEM